MSVRRLLTADTEAAFIVRVAALAVLLLTIPWMAHLVSPDDGALSYGPPAVAALIVVVASIWRPREALLAFALFVLVYNTLALYMGGQIKRFDELSVPGLALIGAWRALPRWRTWFWWPRELALGVVLLAALASSLLNGVPIQSWAVQLVLLTKGIIIFYVALWTSARTFEIAAGMKVVLGIGLVILALGLIELINPPLFQKTLGLDVFIHARGPLFSVKSIFFHPVIFSWFTAFVALYAWTWYLVSRRRSALLLAAAFSFGPFLGQRRRAILALFGGLFGALVEALVRGRGDTRAVLRRFAPVGATMALILVLFIPVLANLWDRTLQNYVQIPSDVTGENVKDAGEAPPQVRIALYEGSLEVAVANFPFGGGLGRWGSWMSRQPYSPLYYEYPKELDAGVSKIRGLKPTNPINATDTFWPQILGELGLAGLAGYVVFLACLGIGLWRASGRYAGGILRIFTLGSGMVLVQAVIESLASPMFHSPPRAYLTYVVIGVAIALLRGPAEEADAAAPRAAEPRAAQPRAA
jgi:hypothetical protein